MIKFAIVPALAVVLLAGCGTQPQALRAPIAPAAQSAEARGLFGSFKEAAYEEISLTALRALECDAGGGETCRLDGPNRLAAKGKKFKITGPITFGKGSMSIAPYVISVGEIQVQHKMFLSSNSAERYLQKLGATHWTKGQAETVTAYVTFKSPNKSVPYTFDAIKRADGKLIRL